MRGDGNEIIALAKSGEQGSAKEEKIKSLRLVRFVKK